MIGEGSEPEFTTEAQRHGEEKPTEWRRNTERGTLGIRGFGTLCLRASVVEKSEV
ncbi:MAG: hypothetical protein RIQ79_971 [Verrucomicrobiota bacterium]|jgi:hypothetical protein